MLYTVVFCHGPHKAEKVIPLNEEYCKESQDQAELLRFMAQFPVGSVFEVSTNQE